MDAKLEDIRTPALLRWNIEQSFLDCKNILGLTHSEARSFPAWRRHILFVLMDHLLLTKLRSKFGA
jgi:SRSO17 transposase